VCSGSRSEPGWERRRLAWPRLAAATLAAGAALFGAEQVRPQSHPSVSVAPTISAEPATQAAFPIRVGPADALPRNSFVRVRGLPPMAALSEGHSIAAGSWAVPLAALPNLKITVPAGANGRSDVTVTLVGIDGAVLAEAKSTVVIGAAQSAAGAGTRSTGAPASASILRAAPLPTSPEPGVGTTPEVVPALTPEDRERALRLMKKGDEQMQEGNVSAARLFYERAADAGLAQAAMALAATFDGPELARLNLRGIEPDRKQARRWYERARQLGASDADQRLQRLGATN
jgi:hypothetical protein